MNYEHKREDDPHTIRNEEQEDELVPGDMSYPMAAIAEGCVLHHVKDCLPECERAHKEGNEYPTNISPDKLQE